MTKKKTVTDELLPMKVGEEKEFPAVKAMTVRSMASMLGFQWNRCYRTATDRKRRVVKVTRVE